jgi:hypothetical protein
MRWSSRQAATRRKPSTKTRVGLRDILRKTFRKGWREGEDMAARSGRKIEVGVGEALLSDLRVELFLPNG